MELTRTNLLDDFALTHNQSRKALNSWLQVVRANTWRSLLDVQKIYRSADGGVKGEYTVFNIAGNKFRLITVINYERQIVVIKNVFTHAQYDRWNKQ
jgi:mRNA interferase HigB